MGEAATDMVHVQTDTTENDTTQARRVKGGGGCERSLALESTRFS